MNTIHQLPLLLMLALTVAGCAGLGDVMDDATLGKPQERQAAVLDLEERVRKLRPGDEAAVEDRDRLDRFLRERFSLERDATLREQLLDVALRGELPCAGDLSMTATRDRKWQVRLSGVKGIAQTRPDGMRERLTLLLEKDPHLFVRIEAAKAFRAVGDESWAQALVAVLMDEAENRNLRVQAYRSAVALTGSQLPFVPQQWRDWQARSEGSPVPDTGTP